MTDKKDYWFDKKGVDLLREEVLNQNPNWKKYISDGKIEAHEILEQEFRIIELLREVEPLLDPKCHSMMTKVLLEYEVLFNMALAHYPSMSDPEGYWSLPFENKE